MLPFFLRTGLLFRGRVTENKTCRIFLSGMRKVLGIFDINIFVLNFKKISKIFAAFLHKNLRTQLLVDDLLTSRFRYFWKDNNFFAKFFLITDYTNIRLTPHLQQNLNYFTKKNKFYAFLRKKFLNKQITHKTEKQYTNIFCKQIADLLILINPTTDSYTYQAILRNIPTILITNSEHDLNNYLYSLGLNLKTESQLLIFLSLIKKSVQFCFFNKNVKTLVWKFCVHNLHKNLILHTTHKKTKNLKFIFFKKNYKVRAPKTLFSIVTPIKQLEKKKVRQQNFKLHKIAYFYAQLFRQNYIRKSRFFYNKKQEKYYNQILFQRKNFNNSYKAGLEKKINPRLLQMQKKQQKHFLLKALSRIPKLYFTIGTQKQYITQIKKKKIRKKKTTKYS